MEVTKRENASVFKCMACGKHEDNHSNFYSMRLNEKTTHILCDECFSLLRTQIWDVDTEIKVGEIMVSTGMKKMPRTCDSCSHSCKLPYTGKKLKPLYRLQRHQECPLREK